MVTVGIPRSLAYYSYFPFWKTVLEDLGLQVVVSALTTKAVLDRGVSEATNDLCVPVKLFFGHVGQLQGRVDKILVPRLVSVNRIDTFCPKFLGLPDMMKYGMDDLPPLITPRIDLRQGSRGILELAGELAHTFGCGLLSALRALQRARRVQARFNQLLLQGWTPPEAVEVMTGPESMRPSEEGEVAIAVLGYPYSLYDDYFNSNLLPTLKGMGVKVYTPEMAPSSALTAQSRLLPKQLFWHFSNRVLWAGMHYLARSEVSGIIHISNFACGPDAMVNKLLELEAKKYPLPFLTVTLDEHTGLAGIQTRLEAFVDMVLWRRQKSCR
jgi:predicted nucleotide-binding protein (sugar kinase/HSP70/actin superfamily)